MTDSRSSSGHVINGDGRVADYEAGARFLALVMQSHLTRNIFRRSIL